MCWLRAGRNRGRGKQDEGSRNPCVVGLSQAAFPTEIPLPRRLPGPRDPPAAPGTRGADGGDRGPPAPAAPHASSFVGREQYGNWS